MTAPLIGGASIALAVALVWYFRPQPEARFVLEAVEAPAPPGQAADDATPPPATFEPAHEAPAAAVVPPSDESAAGAEPGVARSPLPGETAATPMAQLLADRQQNIIVRDDPATGALPPGLVEGEREFAAEPIDATWAPGAEAELLGKFAQMQGLKLIDLQVECRSTMCRFQLSQPTGPAMEGSPSAFDVLNKELGLKPRWMMSVVDRPGAPTGKSIAYLWRDGFARRDCFEDGRPTPCSAESDESGK
jgi:hypothetical protein